MTTEAEIIAKHLPIIAELQDKHWDASRAAREALCAFHRAKPNTPSSWEAWSAYEAAKTIHLSAERKFHAALDARSKEIRKFNAEQRRKWNAAR
jgi:hypothetical protein